ncbi:hypothetical protein BDV35DRAFT_343064 [Aspergillus flavus]|uniref:Cyanovirin-N domain-containing protein n=1 Tax=Aspergillus flavus TaxID=5059 RepID=A0A5N6H6B9_ASPFL|nr:hypothetical protein BDV35DRAFT_343064 [Aspergillus flavus]
MTGSTRCTYVHLEDRAKLCCYDGRGSRPFVYLDLCIGLQVGRLVWDDENFSKSARNIALVKKADGWWLEADVEQTNGAYERRALCLEERIECFEDGTIEYV